MKRNIANSITCVRSARFLVLVVATVAVTLLRPGIVSAHDLKASVNPLTDLIRVEAGYDDDTPAEKARVVVSNGSGNTIASGVLDEKGVWTFPNPGPGSYLIVVEIAGHRDKVRLEIPEDSAAVVHTGWRLDKQLGLAIGLVILLGGTLAYVYFRRGSRLRTSPG